MKIQAMILAGVILASPVQAAQWAQAGDAVAIEKDFYGCAKLDDMKKFVRLANENDPIAAMFFVEEHCWHIDAGWLGVIEEVSFASLYACFRPRGIPECVRTPRERLVPIG